MTGPLNPHFVRDIGCAYFDGRRDAGRVSPSMHERRPAALAGGAFLTLHAFVHLWDWASGRESLHHFVDDLPTVFLPPAIALWLALPSRILKQEKHHAEMADSTAHRRV